MNETELNHLLEEAFDHLWNGRYRLALNIAKKVFKARPNDSETLICLAWALLENGDPARAIEYANLAVEQKGDSIKAQLYRGFLLMRMSIFEGAVSDLNSTLEKQKDLIAWTYLNKARALAGLGKFQEAAQTLEVSIMLNDNSGEELKKSSAFYTIANNIKENRLQISVNNIPDFLKKAEDAIKHKEYWFTLYISRKILSLGNKKFLLDASLLELEAMFNLFQFRPALEKAEKLKERFKKNKTFKKIYNKLRNYLSNNFEKELEFDEEKINENQLPEDNISKKTETQYRTDSIFYPNEKLEIVSAKIFDAFLEKRHNKRTYIAQFNAGNIRQVGIEIIFNNLFYQQTDKTLIGKAIWYLSDYEIGRNDFSLEVNKDWDAVIFAQTWGSDKKGFWQKGQGKVEIYVEGFKVCEKYFSINDEEILLPDEKLPQNQIQRTTKENYATMSTAEINEPEESLDDLLEELDGYIGLNNIKDAVKDYITYLQFINERKQKGLKVNETFSLHTIFTGNPGTGKTTIARLMGRIFRAMKILPKGHLLEVDRSSLVGQYIGETAQKTEKVINEAMGGVLFIDEAYTLVKKSGSTQDFGQEAIDVLLKRMEDNKGKFVVIAAGYPDNMKTFIDSNPGLRSRFNKFFHFEDYSPTELFQIFQLYLKAEDYSISEDAAEILKKEFTKLYRKRDRNFGNARVAKRIFEEAKLQLSKRFIALADEEKTAEAMTKITKADIENVITVKSVSDVHIPINEEELQAAMDELNALFGLDKVKKEIQDLIKLARYYNEQGENLKEKFSAHYLFLGNPGTGKTTIARIFSRIFSALGILPKGHLIETDRQGLVANYVGQTAIKTSEIIDKAIGGTLFIDEAYSLIKGGENDFGKEAVDILLKRMEDDRGKFIVVAAGYTEEMKNFIESNPGIQSRFTKTLIFEDYTPENLLEITEKLLKSSNLEIGEKTKKELLRYYVGLYRSRDTKFGNARIVRNLVDSAKQKMLIRLANTPASDRTKEMTRTILTEDIEELNQIINKAKKYVIKTDPEKLKSVLTQLNELTGLKNVKENVNKLVNSLKVAKLRKQKGLQVMERQLHSVFMGNPGTGKTTVARIMSKVYRELGLLERGHLIEVDRADLVAGYSGQTAIKTEAVIKKALGGTLFIDEAYSLSRGSNDFGQEAIDTLLKRMEDYQGEFVVIVAGYTEEMKLFLESNPGLNSRFPNIFYFEDYTPRELLEIADNIAKANGYILDEGALQLFLENFNMLYKKRDNNFGNARLAKNLLYQAISNQEERISCLYEYSKEILMTITYEDVEKIVIDS